MRRPLQVSSSPAPTGTPRVAKLDPGRNDAQRMLRRPEAMPVCALLLETPDYTPDHAVLPGAVRRNRFGTARRDSLSLDLRVQVAEHDARRYHASLETR